MIKSHKPHKPHKPHKSSKYGEDSAVYFLDYERMEELIRNGFCPEEEFRGELETEKRSQGLPVPCEEANPHQRTDNP